MPTPTAPSVTTAPDPRHIRSAMPATAWASCWARASSVPVSSGRTAAGVEHPARHQPLEQPAGAGVEQDGAAVAGGAGRRPGEHNPGQGRGPHCRAGRAHTGDGPVDGRAQHHRHERQRPHPDDPLEGAGDDPAPLAAEHPAHHPGGRRRLRRPVAAAQLGAEAGAGIALRPGTGQRLAGGRWRRSGFGRCRPGSGP